MREIADLLPKLRPFEREALSRAIHSTFIEPSRHSLNEFLADQIGGTDAATGGMLDVVTMRLQDLDRLSNLLTTGGWPKGVVDILNLVRDGKPFDRFLKPNPEKPELMPSPGDRRLERPDPMPSPGDRRLERPDPMPVPAIYKVPQTREEQMREDHRSRPLPAIHKTVPAGTPSTSGT
jgi:hypothetical protein